jgi:hypothetical protein
LHQAGLTEADVTVVVTGLLNFAPLMQGQVDATALGAMTAPQAGWHHDGRFNLLDLVRMVDIEASTEHAAEHFTAYEV